ncbi:MAG: hypothetical protein JWP86_55 [Phenylobacterium sp.]|nr:hypothetical protein [Phenylobacterium sp.]
MGGRQVIYDALTLPVVDPSMISVALFGSLMFSAIAVVSWVRLGRRSAQRGADRSREMMACGVITLMALGGLGFLTYSGVETLVWRYDYAHHQYAVLDGCVAQFHEAVHPDHDLGVDHFTLQGHPFALSDSGWRVGYHFSRHHGSPIENGVHLRAFAQGQRLLRIEVLTPPCPH